MKKVLQFSASWCQPCKQLSKVVESSDLGIPFEYVDIDQNEELVKQYGIRAVPTLIMIEGENEIKRTSGAKNKQELEEWVA